MTNIWPHMLRALPPTTGHHNHGYGDAYDDADACSDGDDDAYDDVGADDTAADDVTIAKISIMMVQSI